MAGSSESRRWLPGGLGTSTSAEVRGSREPLLGLRPLHLCRGVQCPLQLIELTLPGALSARCGRWYVWPLWCSSWCRWRRSLRRSGLLLQPQQVQLRLCGCSTGLLEVQLILQLANAGAAALLRRCHSQNVLSGFRFALGAVVPRPPRCPKLTSPDRASEDANYCPFVAGYTTHAAT